MTSARADLEATTAKEAVSQEIVERVSRLCKDAPPNESKDLLKGVSVNCKVTKKGLEKVRS